MPTADSAELLEELWEILAPEFGSSEEDEDDAESLIRHGYDRSAAERQEDCDRVRTILCEGSISPAVRSRSGASLLCLALQYDHRHAAQMLKVVCEAGADVNAPLHQPGEEWPLDCELWLELEGPFATVNEQKRAYLIARGARQSPGALAAAAAEEASAAAASNAKADARAAADEALERRPREAREEWHAARVPTWDAAASRLTMSW